MKQYNVYKEETEGSPVTIMAVTNQINKWANSLPNHPFKNLGSEISIVKLQKMPAYLIRLRTLYESRNLYKSEVPYKHQPLPELKYSNEKDIDIWSFNLPVSDIFADSTNNYSINGSEQVVPCNNCKATGKVTCPSCKGKKEEMCTRCNGSGLVKCKLCHGTKTQKCSSCDGKGYKEHHVVHEIFDHYEYVGNKQIPVNRRQTDVRKESCLVCYGKGVKECYACRGKGSETCKTCNGEGSIPCKNCSATGTVSCPVCNGNKYMVSSFNITKRESTKRNGKFIINKTVAEFSKEYSQKIEEFQRVPIYSNVANIITTEILPENSFIDGDIQKLIDLAASSATPNYRIARQKLEIESLDTLVLDYGFRGKQYRMLLAGREMTIIAGESPISEHEKSIIEAAKEQLRNGKETEAYYLFKKAQAIDSFNQKEMVVTGLDTSFRRIQKYHKRGRLSGILISTIVFFPYLYYYYFNINKVFGYAAFMKDPDFFLFRHHPWTMLAVAFLLQYSAWKASLESMNSSGKFIKSRKGRVTAALFLTIFISAVLQAMLIALNATAFTLIFTFFGWLFTFWV